MFQGNRGVDETFTSQERLFHRCAYDWLDSEGKLKHANVSFPDQSVNREKYSKPFDVILPDRTPRTTGWIYWGVAAIRVEQIPEPEATSGGGVFEFRVEHDPEFDNFSHSEIRVFKNGKHESRKGNINHKVKMAYRYKIAQRAVIVLRPCANSVTTEPLTE